jgi:hypothetical protein
VEKTNTYSIRLRLRRVIYEDAYIDVPVTGKIMDNKDDGTASLNVDAFVAEALRLSQDESVEWIMEESKIEPHPVQGPMAAGRKAFIPPER